MKLLISLLTLTFFAQANMLNKAYGVSRTLYDGFAAAGVEKFEIGLDIDVSCSRVNANFVACDVIHEDAAGKVHGFSAFYVYKYKNGGIELAGKNIDFIYE